MAIVTYNDNGTIKVVKFGNYVVSTDADPVVQKQWVFVEGSATSWGTPYEQTGIQETVYNSQGCASPTTLGIYLDSQVNPNGLGVGTKAAVRMNGQLGDCGTWARFQVEEV